jgi:hypothetical protein
MLAAVTVPWKRKMMDSIGPPAMLKPELKVEAAFVGKSVLLLTREYLTAIKPPQFFEIACPICSAGAENNENPTTSPAARDK